MKIEHENGRELLGKKIFKQKLINRQGVITPKGKDFSRQTA